MPGEASGPAATPGARARHPDAAPCRVPAGPPQDTHVGPERRQAGRACGYHCAGRAAESSSRSGALCRPPDAETPQEGAGTQQEGPGCGRKSRDAAGSARSVSSCATSRPPPGALARPLAARRDAWAGRLREGRVGGGRESWSAPPAPGPAGSERRTTVQLVCFLQLLADYY